MPSRKPQNGKPINSNGRLSRKETPPIIGIVITGSFTICVAIIMAFGPDLFERFFPKQVPDPVLSSEVQPTLTLPQYASSLTSSCNQTAPEQVAIVSNLTNPLSPPIRFDFVSVEPARYLLPQGFDPETETFQDEESIKQLPAVDLLELYIDIVGLNEKEWIRVENFMLVRFDSVQDLPAGNVNVAESVFGGGGRNFHISACWQGQAETNTPFATSQVNSMDLFTISPGELVPFWLTLDVSGLEPSIYTFHIGVVYTYEGETHAAWSDRSFSLVVPHNGGRTDWIYHSTEKGIVFIPDNSSK